jgi:hypothetical protein
MARLLSVNVGLPRDIAWQGRTVHIAVWKEPVQGRRMVRRLNIDGDGQDDLARTAGRPPRSFAAQPGQICYSSPGPADRPALDFEPAITRRKSATDFVTPSIGGNARSSCSIDSTSS